MNICQILLSKSSSFKPCMLVSCFCLVKNSNVREDKLPVKALPTQTLLKLPPHWTAKHSTQSWSRVLCSSSVVTSFIGLICLSYWHLRECMSANAHSAWSSHFPNLVLSSVASPDSRGADHETPWTIVASPKGPPFPPRILDPLCLWEQHVLMKTWHFLKKREPENRRAVLVLWSNEDRERKGLAHSTYLSILSHRQITFLQSY